MATQVAEIGREISRRDPPVAIFAHHALGAANRPETVLKVVDNQRRVNQQRQRQPEPGPGRSEHPAPTQDGVEGHPGQKQTSGGMRSAGDPERRAGRGQRGRFAKLDPAPNQPQPERCEQRRRRVRPGDV